MTTKVLDKHAYAMMICEVVANKSTCDRAHVGCVFFTPSFEVVTTGYNGAPSGQPHCDDIGHELVDGRCVRTTHAEQNAIVQAAKRGVIAEGVVVYVTHSPCYTCAKLLATLHVKEVRYRDIYDRDIDRVEELFDSCNITFVSWESI